MKKTLILTVVAIFVLTFFFEAPSGHAILGARIAKRAIMARQARKAAAEAKEQKNTGAKPAGVPDDPVPAGPTGNDELP